MSTHVATGFSDLGDPLGAAREAAKLAFYQMRHRAVSLGLVFMTVHYAVEAAVDGLMEILSGIPLIGSSGAAVITDQGVKEYGIGVMLIHCEKMQFVCGSATGEGGRSPQEIGEAFGHDIIHRMTTPQKDRALIFSDGLIENESNMIRGIKMALGSSFPIYGAASADNFRLKKTFQLFGPKLFSGGIVGTVMLGERLVGVGIRHGWKPLGKPRTITEAQGPVIKKIGQKPAVALYEEYFGKTRSQIEKLLIRMSVYYPLGIYLPGEPEYLLRNAIRVDAQGGLICQSNVPQNAEVRLMMATKDGVIEAAKKAALDARQAIPNKILKAGIILESSSRHRLLGRLANREIEVVKEAFGRRIPVLGLSTFGEQAPLQSIAYSGETYCHNETIAVLALGESHV